MRLTNAVSTTAGSREVAQGPGEVWRALAALPSYCAVCDVSYVLTGPAPGRGTRFVCVPGRLDGRRPAATAPQGEIVDWDPPRLIAARLELTPETWTTRIELADTATGGTRVTITLSHHPRSGGRLMNRLARPGVQRLIQRTVADELRKLPEHLAQAATEPTSPGDRATTD